MPEKHLFEYEYAIIRIVPRVEREEFLNVGVVLYCRPQRFLKTMITLDEERLKCFAPATDPVLMKSYLDAFGEICMGNKQAGPIAQGDPASRFRWLTANRSTILQTSRVHPGLTTNPEATLRHLFETLVLLTD
ncbi:DUF3037 domain-containing protein [Chitinophaga sp. Cy-1792]|uniref:DUF3037 domain-containing protein n=1 Tax=Chitinophaga sp. Cy-1792 TaxID=2608339 RepID=UPI001423E1C4|nr:DUF3037 domain-containing protein [Chitinophaga sp. Cy-1792]NIG57480.1 DUF3037 domain-containing protein [Chitinophaga sp. Cy-1792]